MDTIQSTMEDTSIERQYRSIIAEWKKKNMEAENTTFECREELEECLDTVKVDPGKFKYLLDKPIDRVVKALEKEIEGLKNLKEILSNVP